MPLQTLDAAFSASPFGRDPWTLLADRVALELPQAPPVFTLGDGFVGIRGPGDSAGAPRVYLNGVFETTSIAYHEAAHGYAVSSDTRVAVADATRLSISVDGVDLPVESAELDMAAGFLRETRRTSDVAVVIETLVPMAHKGVVATRIRVSADENVRVTIRRIVMPPSGPPVHDLPYDPRVAPVIDVRWTEETVISEPAIVGRVDRLSRSGFTVAVVARRLDTVLELAPGETRVLDGLAVYAAVRGDDPLVVATAALAALPDHDQLVAEQRSWYASFWRNAGLELAEDPAAQALRHGLFQLVQAVGRDGSASLSAKGQTGEGYEGHVFWDAEIYALPVFVYLMPEIARAMLTWRIDRLDAARANARLLGHAQGALYPWRTIAGAECSSFFPAGAAQSHINADIAHALQLYVATTGDCSILEEGGAVMLAETARIWLQVGFH
ncbi:MAG: glycoside hydrolase family 65 protein, partial [Hyphomicrobium sp.]|nr:glycoside hydrolase family 65 protein [Hyphomicrobium sp.]